VTRFRGPRFSLLTLLLAMAWCAAVVWINTLPRVTVSELPFPETSGQIRVVYWGWPCPYRSGLADFPRVLPPRLVSAWAWALSADAAVGLLLVAALTWCSNQLLRRVGATLRRRTAGESKS
jgi:hypothetical protein